MAFYAQVNEMHLLAPSALLPLAAAAAAEIAAEIAAVVVVATVAGPQAAVTELAAQQPELPSAASWPS